MSETVYRPIPGFPDCYRVGDDGSLWSRRTGGVSRGGVPRPLLPRFRRLKGTINPDGYHACLLVNSEGVKVSRRVHTLVLLAFVGPAPAGMECCHEDRDRRNNRLGNLRWGTAKDNAADRTRHGTGVRGERTANALFTDEQVRLIKVQLAAGRSRKSIASEHEVCLGTIDAIAQGRTWAHVTA